MTTLFSDFGLKHLALPNRVVMAPMSRVRAGEGGLATASMATYYAQRATAGLIISEGIWPNAVGQSNPGTPGLASTEQADSWRQVTGAVHANGGRIFAQIMHGGRVSHHDTTGLRPVGPSAIAAPDEGFTPTGPQPFPVPRALTTAEVPEQAGSYAEASRRAVDAGFDGVEIHGANGYLISQFLSNTANQRIDHYGGAIQGRIRFAVEAIAAVAAAIGGDRVGVRLSPGAGLAGAQENDVLDLYTELLSELAGLDIAYVHLEATTDDDVLVELRRVWPGVLIMNPAFPMGPKPTDRAGADRWLDLGADLISFGRAFIANPDLVERLRTGAPIAPADEAVYFMGADNGYITYPSYQYSG